MLRAARSRRAFAAVLTIGLAVALGACGSSSSSSDTSSGSPGAGSSTTSSNAAGGRPTVLAAASLTKVFPEIEPDAKYTFGGSGALETDIEQGAPADVFAAASPEAAGRPARQGPGGQAGPVRHQHARADRAQGQPGAHQVGERHHQPGGEARYLRRERAVRRLRPDGVQEPRTSPARR